MTTDMNQTLDETFLNDAATEAVGAHVVEESDAFLRRLAAATPQERRVARELREAAACLAAASPYMEPPAELREKLLAATAPQTFKLEDYRKARGERSGFFRWGFAAAVLFLAGAAWFNYSLKTQLDTQTTAYTQQVASLQHQMSIQNDALAALTDPSIKKIMLEHDGKTQGVLAMSGDRPVMVLLGTNVPPDTGAKIRMTVNGTKQEVLAAVVGTGSSQGQVAAGGHAETEIGDVKTAQQLTYRAGFDGLQIPGVKLK